MSPKVKSKSARPRKESTSFDSAWKDVIEYLFEDFLKFFFPHIHNDIDFSIKPVFLDKELMAIKPYGNVGRRYVDKLVKVYLKNGNVTCIYIHIEVHGRKENEGVFEQQSFIYNYRIFDKNIKKDIKVISLAILTDEDKNYRPDEYFVHQWGFELRMKIPMIKIVDFQIERDLINKLETSSNPMSMVVRAQITSYRLKNADDMKKSTVKWELIRQCYERKYPKTQIRALLKFIDWIIRLPDELNDKIADKIITLEEDYKMAYVTSWERSAEKRGIKIGEERGEERGEKQGKLEVAGELLKNGITMDIVIKSTGLTREEIEAFLKQD